MGPPFDRAALGYAVGGLALALVTALLGICLILAFGNGRTTFGACPKTAAVATETTRSDGEHTARSRGTEIPATCPKSTEPPTIGTELWIAVGALAGALLALLVPVPARPKDRYAAVALAVLAVLAVIACRADWNHFAAYAVIGSAVGLGLLIPSPAEPERT